MRVVYPDASPAMGALLHQGPSAVLPELTVYENMPATEDELIERIHDATAVILGWSFIGPTVLAACPVLRIISFTGVGVENFVDIEAATHNGVVVTNTPHYGDETVAEHTLALLLAVARRIVPLDSALRQGRWEQASPGIELRGKVLGILGTGGVGSRVAALSRALGMQVVAWTSNPSRERATALGVSYLRLEELSEFSDIVSLHLALTPATIHIVDANFLSRTKRGALLINTSRGEIVDTGALVDALERGHLGGAALDVFEEEPLPPTHPLLAMNNVVLTPHVGFYTAEATARMLHMAVENIVAFIQGRPQNVVNLASAEALEQVATGNGEGARTLSIESEGNTKEAELGLASMSAKPRVVITASAFDHPTRAASNLLERAGFSVHECPCELGVLRQERLAELARDANALIVSAGVSIDSAVIEGSDRLRHIAVRGVGIQGVDVVLATHRGILVTNTPRVNADAVADLALGLIVALVRGIITHDRMLKSRRWERTFSDDLTGKTLSVLGFGHVGRALAIRARALGLKIVACDIVQDIQAASLLDVTFVCFEEALRRADVLSLHVPLTPQTTGMINKHTIGFLRPSAYLINTARGQLVDEDALFDALTGGQLAGAALDVFAQEPTTNWRLVTLPNVIALPHVAAMTHKTWLEMGLAAAQAVIDVWQGKRPTGLVNPQAWKD